MPKVPELTSLQYLRNDMVDFDFWYVYIPPHHENDPLHLFDGVLENNCLGYFEKCTGKCVCEKCVSFYILQIKAHSL